MNANEFLHKKDVAYMNRLSISLDFNAVVSLMEEYAALRIHDVVWQSEQLPCDCNVELAETTLQVYCPKCYKTHKMK